MTTKDKQQQNKGKVRWTYYVIRGSVYEDGVHNKNKIGQVSAWVKGNSIELQMFDISDKSMSLRKWWQFWE